MECVLEYYLHLFVFVWISEVQTVILMSYFGSYIKHKFGNVPSYHLGTRAWHARPQRYWNKSGFDYIQDKCRFGSVWSAGSLWLIVLLIRLPYGIDRAWILALVFSFLEQIFANVVSSLSGGIIIWLQIDCPQMPFNIPWVFNTSLGFYLRVSWWMGKCVAMLDAVLQYLSRCEIIPCYWFRPFVHYNGTSGNSIGQKIGLLETFKG